MKQLLTTAALLLMVLGSGATAQTTQDSRPAVIDSIPTAPVGHRQPRAADVPSEKNLSNPNDPVNREDAALDRKIKSICRGC